MTQSDETRTELRAKAEAADLHGIQDCAVGMSRGYRSYVYATKPDVILALLDEIDQLRAERDEARTEHQRLWSQYQQELAAIAAWQQRAKGTLDRVRAVVVSSDPGRLGGVPCVRGTRVPADQVVDLMADVGPEDIPRYYPTVEPWQAAILRALDGEA